MKHAFMEYLDWCERRDVLPSEAGFVEWIADKTDRDYEEQKDKELGV